MRIGTVLAVAAVSLVSAVAPARGQHDSSGAAPLRAAIERAGESDQSAVPAPNAPVPASERRDSVWNGALIGLAAAGAPWLIACAANDWCYYNEYGAENQLRMMAVTTAAIGAGIGALIDLSIRPRRSVPSAAAGPDPALAVSVAVTVGHASLSVTRRF